METITNPTHVNNLLTEKAKEDKDYLIQITDLTIAQLVKEKDDVRKAFNYYNGIRDKDQFRHLEEIYGLGTPTAIEFIPLVRPHIDLLIGELLQVPFKPQVTCKDKKTLTKINREKQTLIAKLLYEETQSRVNNIFTSLILLSEGRPSGPTTDPFIEKQLVQIKEDLTKSFISEYEIAVQYLIEYFKQSRNLDLLNKRKDLFKYLLIAGECYYNTVITKKGAIPELEIIHPLDAFVEQSGGNQLFRNHLKRAVIRRKISRQEVLLRYGKYLSPEDLEKVERFVVPGQESNSYYMASNDSGIIAGVTPTVVGALPNYPDGWYDWFYKDLIVVYEVQFIAANEYKDGDEVKFRLDRYETVKIGEDIYILKGKASDEEVFRSAESPDDLTLTLNGICYSDAEGRPYSLMLATANLQDKYDILHFHRDNLIALSGVKGMTTDVSAIPVWMGDTPEERILKSISYRKAGSNFVDTMQEGATQMNTVLGVPFDDTVSGQALQAIQFAIDQTEQVCTRITGVFRERLGAIEQKDAVSNVQTGIRQSAIITKQYFQAIDSITKEMLSDLINACRITLKEGFLGSIILGNSLSQIFEIKPEYFSYTDYDIHIDDSGDIVRDMQKIETLSYEMIKSGLTDIDVIISAIGSHSMSQMKFDLLQAYDKKKKENNELQKLNELYLQLQNQAKELSQQVQKLLQENEQLKAKDRELEKYKVDKQFELGIKTLNVNESFNKEKLEIDKRRVELEQVQLMDNNPGNDEIKNY